MKLPQPYKCDYCGKQKEESNHWYVLFPTINTPGGFETLVFYRWEDIDPDGKSAQHICSESCAAKALSKWMSRGEQPKAVKLNDILDDEFFSKRLG